jgi:polyisoprenyl-phosphate glycosyltransferase
MLALESRPVILGKVRSGPVNTVSIVAPAFNETSNIPRLLERIERALGDTENWELIVVDDGSTDDTLPTLQALAKRNPRLRYLSFTRNFGHQIALKAGLDHAHGSCVISLDADLQHPPELLADMLRTWRAGYEVVNMIRKDTHVPWFKAVTSRLFYAFTNAVSDCRIEQGSSDFRLLDQRVVEVLRGIEERNLFLRGLIPWLGFRQTNLSYEQADRFAGSTKYGLQKMLRLAILGLTSSSLRPLHVSTLVGACMSVLALCYAAFAVWARFFTDRAITGWTSLLISVLLIGGINLLMLGIVGEYLGRTLTEIKSRPLYVLRERHLSDE